LETIPSGHIYKQKFIFQIHWINDVFGLLFNEFVK
jgi:hypothetical protein